MAPAIAPDPRTPSPNRRGSFTTRNLVDSPFSDYCSDGADSAAASPAQAKLLNRLNGVRSELLRRTLSDDASRAVSADLDALEVTMRAPEVRSREPADSGFMDDEDELDGLTAHIRRIDFTANSTTEEELDEDGDDDDDDEDDEHMGESCNGMGIRMSGSPDSVLLDSPPTESAADGPRGRKLVLDLEEARRLIARVTQTAAELKLRLEEVKHTNDEMVMKFESASNTMLGLRSENEGLRQQMKFDHTELLFLKLQLKGVEVAIDTQGDRDGKRYRRAVSASLDEGIERWKNDWDEVNLKFQARRAKYGLAEAPSAPVDTGLKREAAEFEHVSATPPRPARLPKKIDPVGRPGRGARSFTAPGPCVQPPTPSDTTADAESDGDGAVERDVEHVLDSDAITTSEEGSDGDDGDGFDDEIEDLSDADGFDDEEEEEEEEEGSSEEEGEIEVEEPAPAKTPWQELWDSLTEFTGMDQLED